MNYYIRFDNKSNVVELWSTKRLPFEPKGWLLEMRNSLKGALKNLKYYNDTPLKAVYTSNLKEFCDVENILLYNIGTGTFKQLCQQGVYLERRIESPPEPPIQLEGNDLHHHIYSTGDETTLTPYWVKKDDLVCWTNVPCRPLIGEVKPHDIWYTMKSGFINAYPHKPESLNQTYYGISIKVMAPLSTKINLAGVLKPLLDGIISSFHSHIDIKRDVNVFKRLATRLKKDEFEIKNKLSETKNAVLGSRCLLHPFGKGIQWNPADDLFTQIKVVLDTSKEYEYWSFSGEIYTIYRPT